jgi:hypothetical protein
MAAEAERTTELDRIIFFSDGVFPVVVFGISIPIAFVSTAAAQLSWLSFLVVRRIVEVRYGDAGRDEGAFA